jgi:hypothetical protein
MSEDPPLDFNKLAKPDMSLDYGKSALRGLAPGFHLLAFQANGPTGGLAGKRLQFQGAIPCSSNQCGAGDTHLKTCKGNCADSSEEVNKSGSRFLKPGAPSSSRALSVPQVTMMREAPEFW